MAAVPNSGSKNTEKNIVKYEPRERERERGERERERGERERERGETITYYFVFFFTYK